MSESLDRKGIARANPVHPGEIFLEEVLKPLEVSVTQATAMLGVSRQALSALVNRRSDLSAEMAFRIEKAFGPKAELMMCIQNAYSMARARRWKEKILGDVRVFRSEKHRRSLAKNRHMIPAIPGTIPPDQPQGLVFRRLFGMLCFLQARSSAG